MSDDDEKTGIPYEPGITDLAMEMAGAETIPVTPQTNVWKIPDGMDLGEFLAKMSARSAELREEEAENGDDG